MNRPEFSNRRTPPTDADFEVPPGILPGRRLPDWCYMDDDVAPAPPKPALDVFEFWEPSFETKMHLFVK